MVTEIDLDWTGLDFKDLLGDEVRSDLDRYVDQVNIDKIDLDSIWTGRFRYVSGQIMTNNNVKA